MFYAVQAAYSSDSLCAYVGREGGALQLLGEWGREPYSLCVCD